MATIGTAIEIYDRVSRPINSMIAALGSMCDTLESVDRSMDGTFDSGLIDQTRRKVEETALEVIQLGRDTENAENKQREYNDAVKHGGSAMDSLVSKAGMLVAALGLRKVIGDAIEFASNLQEVQNVVDVTFGQSSQRVNEWAKNTLNAFGLNELSAKKMAGTMGAMLKSSGLGGSEVEDMSMKLTELAGDMASFYNLEGQEAFDKLRAGISGETEPLKALGVNMSVANLEAYALSQGLTKSYDKMSQAEQTMLRYNYIMQATADSQGDFARTSDSFANQQKLLSENWKALAGDIATTLLPYLAEAMQKLNAFIQTLRNNASSIKPIFEGIGTVLGWLVDLAIVIADNWSILAPIIGGAATMLGLYLIATKGVAIWQAITNGVMTAFKAIQTFVSIGYGVLTGNTAAASAAQFVYNSALLACPLTWIIMLIIALIAVIYAVVAAINKVTGSTISATGVIIGAVATMVAFVWNLIVGVINGIIQYLWTMFVEPFIGIVEFILNVCNVGFNSFGDAVANLIGQIIGWFLSLGTVVTKIIDAIFGTNWTAGLNSLKKSVTSWGKNEKAITLSREAPELSDIGVDRWAYGDAWNAGYGMGKGIDDAVSGAFGGGGNIFDPDQYTSTYEASQMPSNIASIAENTGDMKDSMDITKEELKYLRDIAERDTINRFTTAEISVNMTNNNNISSDMDLDGVVDYLVIGVNEAMATAAEGVHV